MKVSGLIGWALLIASLHATPASARDQLGQRDEVEIDPTRAYIFYRSGERFDVRFLREVTAEQRLAHEARRAEAFAEARARYERRLAAWERLQVSCQGLAARTNRCSFPEPRPVEVTSETFPFSPPEADNFTIVSRGPQFTREDGAYSYLVAVEPGTYMLYGQIAATQNGDVGVCLCMGSLRFEAPAGRIVDLGELRYPRLEGARGEGAAAASGRIASMQVVPFQGSMAVPARLGGLPVVPARFRAADKVPNYFGVEIDRHPAVAGILGYERDRVIDLGAGEPPQASPLDDAGASTDPAGGTASSSP